MKKNIITLTIILLLAGCKAETSSLSSPSASALAATPNIQQTIIPPVTPEPTPIPVVERFQMPFQGELLLFDHHYSDITGWAITRNQTNEGFLLSFTENQGVDWFTAVLPTKQTWENSVDKKHLFASLNPAGSSWVMLSSEPSASIVHKTLYRSEDKGRSWSLLGDFASLIDGDIKGIMFIDDNKGWIASSYRGSGVVPLYRTLDGGKTWSLEVLPLEKGFRYASVGLPYFNQEGHAAVRVEYVSDSGNKTVYYESIDNGNTWRRFAFNSILQLNGDKAALEVVKQFAVAWQNQDEKKVRALFEKSNLEYVSQYIAQMKNQKSTFYSSFSTAKENEPTVGEFCVTLFYQNDKQAENDVGSMWVCLRKQPKSNAWRIYMLD